MSALDPSTSSLISSSYPGVDTSLSVSEQSKTAFPSQNYTPEDLSALEPWLSRSSSPADSSFLTELNTHLSTRTTLLGSKPSIADVILYARIAPVVKGWSDEEQTGKDGRHHVVRYVDYVQNAPVYGLKISQAEKVAVDADKVLEKIKPVDPKAEKERKKREKEAAALAAGGAGAGAGTAATTTAASSKDASKSDSKTLPERVKEKAVEAKDKVAAAVTDGPKKERKEKAPKQPKPPKAAPVEKPLSPSLIDLRVGHILKATTHPNADSLYVSTIACGDAPGTDNTSEYEGQIVRTVCSGLNGLVPLEEMQNRKIVAVCNLKPVTMRGIKSAAMVLAASPRLKEGETDDHKGPVELVEVPAGAKAGDRVAFEGWEGEPEAVLNPKKKQWEAVQPGFTTTEEGVVVFDPEGTEGLKGKGSKGKLVVGGEACTVKTLRGAVVR
ncbi:tRNA-aminoacylation cofactor arc1 [Sphaceloma murrayae]|uniref:tRNA-aminoacylation cofactor arc1 n=1 Tax=Sphaceloma murrayae TaxID=2082308 RepID=A0A2K1QTI0_9PEZI|nr:tRNA-aminoacylation cofactor arc1 [Sphaceloma murrayae]